MIYQVHLPNEDSYIEVSADDVTVDDANNLVFIRKGNVCSIFARWMYTYAEPQAEPKQPAPMDDPEVAERPIDLA